MNAIIGIRTRIVGTILIASMSWASVSVSETTEGRPEKADPLVSSGVIAGSAMVTGTAFLIVGFLEEEEWQYVKDGEIHQFDTNRNTFIAIGGALLGVALLVGAVSYHKRTASRSSIESARVDAGSIQDSVPLHFKVVNDGVYGSGICALLWF